MLRLFLVVLGWPLAVLLIVSCVLWYREQFPESPDDIVLEPERVRAAQRVAGIALDRLRSLPPAEQRQLVERLSLALQPPQQWLDELARADERILCLGEHHEPSTRRFLVETFFSRNLVDVLLLEATPTELARIEQSLADGREYVPLLNADIGGVLRSVRRHNPAVIVRGIEETSAQVRVRKDREGSRDQTLARNFWQSWQAGRRNVILYGALHCSDESNWLYRHLREQMPAREQVSMRNVRVVGIHQHGPTLAFAHFVHVLDLSSEDFVIPDTGAVPARVRRWFSVFDQHILQRYETAVVFRYAADGVMVATSGSDESVSNESVAGDARAW